MITKFTHQEIEKVIEIVKNREIGFIKILKQNGDYYIEYRKCQKNNSSKVLDLLIILEDFKKEMNNNSLSNFYLYYNIDTDNIIHNTNTISKPSDGVDIIEPYDVAYDNKVEVLDSLKLIKKKIQESNLDKIVLVEGKKRMNTTYDKVLDKLISDIKTNL